MKNKNYTYPVLYTFRRCPYAIRARMALSYSQIKVELKEILLSNRPSALYAVSQKGTVPVLCINDNQNCGIDCIIYSCEQSTINQNKI